MSSSSSSCCNMHNTSSVENDNNDDDNHINTHKNSKDYGNNYSNNRNINVMMMNLHIMSDGRLFINRQNYIQWNKENNSRYITLINYVCIDKLFDFVICLSHLFILSLLPPPYFFYFY